MACCFACILQSGGGGGLSAQIGALQQSWRANAPADFARVKFCAGAVAVRYAHLAATAINMRTGGGKCAFVGLSECRGRSLYRLDLVARGGGWRWRGSTDRTTPFGWFRVPSRVSGRRFGPAVGSPAPAGLMRCIRPRARAAEDGFLDNRVPTRPPPAAGRLTLNT